MSLYSCTPCDKDAHEIRFALKDLGHIIQDHGEATLCAVLGRVDEDGEVVDGCACIAPSQDEDILLNGGYLFGYYPAIDFIRVLDDTTQECGGVTVVTHAGHSDSGVESCAVADAGVREVLRFAESGMNWGNGVIKDVVVQAVERIRQNPSEYEQVLVDWLWTMRNEGVTKTQSTVSWCLLETVWPGRGNQLIGSVMDEIG